MPPKSFLKEKWVWTEWLFEGSFFVAFFAGSRENLHLFRCGHGVHYLDWHREPPRHLPMCYGWSYLALFERFSLATLFCCKIQWQGIGNVAYAIPWILGYEVSLHLFWIPLFPHMTFMGARGIFTSSMDIDIIYWHQKTLKMNSLSIDKLKNVKMITWCIGWLTSNIRMPLVLAATVQTAFAGWIPIINIIIIIILVFLWEDDFIKT